MTDSHLKNYTTSILFELWTQKFKRKYRIPNDKTRVAISDAFVHFLRIVLHAQIKPGKRFIKAQAPYFTEYFSRTWLSSKTNFQHTLRFMSSQSLTQRTLQLNMSRWVVKFMSQFPFSEQRVHWLFPNEQRLYLSASPDNADLSTFVVRINYRVYVDCEPVFKSQPLAKLGRSGNKN